MKNWRRLAQVPIAGRLTILLVGALIVSQGVTLILTLVFPPQPPPQHSLEDIADAMRGQKVMAEGARPLLREIVNQPPRPSGPGWLSAAEPRDQLARILDADPADIILMFYLPLPAGGEVMSSPQNARLLQRQTVPAVVAPKPPPAPEAKVVSAAFAPTEENPLLVRASFSPSEQPSAAFDAPRPMSLPNRGPPNDLNASSRDGARRQRASRPFPESATMREQAQRPWSNARRDLTLQNDHPARAFPNSGSPSVRPDAIASNRIVAAPGRSQPLAQSVSDNAVLQPGGVGIGRGLAAAMVSQRQGQASPHLKLGAPMGVSLAASPQVQTAKPTAPSPILEELPTPRKPATSPMPTNTAERASVVEVAPPAEDEAEAETESGFEAASTTATSVVPAPLPMRRGLFAPPPAGYIEGNFIAAQRIGDRWIVVQPSPEGFPTAWQSRVMLWFLLSFALVAPFGWLFARRITAPLRSFADAAERLGRDPSASAIVQGGSAEIGRAATAFNQMQARLKRYVDDRTAMIGAISHDLRTPLTRMRFRLEAAPERMKSGFETDIDQMEAMISSVLAFMRDQAEAGSRQRLELRALLNAAVNDAVSGGADIAIEPGETVEVDADAVALNRVFANLLDNAVKYGGRAVVHLDRQGDHVVAAVRDFGPGLPDSELDRVFKPFYRTPGAASSDAPGIGLGLANSRAIVLAHGGTIRLKSDHGLTAEVRLPVAA